MTRKLPRKLLRPVEVGDVDVDILDTLQNLIGAEPAMHYADYDWKEWASLVESIAEALKDRGFRPSVPPCRLAENLTDWLERVNAMVGRPENFADRKAFELLDVEGSDQYTILLWPQGTPFPGFD